MGIRQIKFKAKRLDNGEWVEGLPTVNSDDKTCILVLEPKDDGCGRSFIPVDPSTVCQYTGIYDKDNKEIYENDLVQDTQTKEVSAVVWNPIYACYSFLDEKRNRYAAKNFADYPSKYFHIVGNMFDRKEGEK